MMKSAFSEEALNLNKQNLSVQYYLPKTLKALLSLTECPTVSFFSLFRGTQRIPRPERA